VSVVSSVESASTRFLSEVFAAVFFGADFVAVDLEVAFLAVVLV
jgi:hypothetical protein